MKVSRQHVDYEFGVFTRQLIFEFRWGQFGTLVITVSDDNGKTNRKLEWWMIPVMFGDQTWSDLKDKAQAEAVEAPECGV